MKTIRNLLIAAVLIVAGNVSVMTAGNKPGDNKPEVKTEISVDREMVKEGATKKLFANNGIHIAYQKQNGDEINLLAVYQKHTDGLIKIIQSGEQQCFNQNFIPRADNDVPGVKEEIELGFHPTTTTNVNAKKSEGIKASMNKMIEHINTSARNLIKNKIIKNETAITMILGSTVTLTIAAIAYAGYKLTKSFKKDKDNDSDQNGDSENVESPTNAA